MLMTKSPLISVNFDSNQMIKSVKIKVIKTKLSTPLNNKTKPTLKINQGWEKIAMKKKNKRLEWLRVNINKKKNDLVVNKYPKQGSGMISSIVYSDGILEIPEEVSNIRKDQIYKFYSFKNLFD